MSDREIDVLSLDSHRDKGNRRGSFSGLHIIVVRNIIVCVDVRHSVNMK